MAMWSGMAMDVLWRNALGVIPVVLVVAVTCRLIPCRPWTRHSLWLLVLGFLIAAPLLPEPWSGSSEVATTQPADGDELEVDRAAETDAAIPAASTDAQPSAPRPSHSPKTQQKPHRAGDSVAGPPEPTPRLATIRPAGTRHESLSTFAPPPSPIHLSDPPQTPELNSGILLAPVLPRDEPPAAASSSGVAVDDPALLAWAVGGATLSLGPHPVVPQWWASAAKQWSAWLGQLASLRDALVGISPLPWPIWALGAVLVLGMRLLAIQRLRLRVRRGVPAPPEVQCLVEASARVLGLRSAPQTRMVPDRLSPMVWIGRSPILILPVALWRDLDDQGRRAVVLHELAHIRRRDHWICRFDLLIGAVYWWHPVAWWARHQVRAAAEDCCDAWVTWLRPRERRAYAQALLAAKQFAGSDHRPDAALAIGITTRTAKRFTRRITMIMTRSDRPRSSFTGAALVAAVALVGWFVAPVLACPPKDCKAKKGCQEEEVEQKQLIRAEPEAEPSPEPLLAVLTAGQEDRGDDHLERRLDRLERRLDKLARQLERMSGSWSSAPPSPPAAPAAPKAPKAPKAPAAPKPPRGLLGGNSKDSQKWAEKATWKTYTLPDGKLEDLTTLMVRSDVPILVSPGKRHIRVQATEAQHRVFAAFVAMISGEPLPDDGFARGFSVGSPGFAIAEFGRAQAEAGEALRAARAQARTRAGEISRDVKRHVRELQAKARAMARQADSTDVRADRMRERAERLVERIERSAGRERDELGAEFETLEQVIEELHEAAEQLREQSEALLEQAEATSEEAAEAHELEFEVAEEHEHGDTI